MAEREPADRRVEVLERRVAEQERALDELRADLAIMAGKLAAVLEILSGRHGPRP
jgi:uncharacterized coiled-coil protein SlyX